MLVRFLVQAPLPEADVAFMCNCTVNGAVPKPVGRSGGVSSEADCLFESCVKKVEKQLVLSYVEDCRR